MGLMPEKKPRHSGDRRGLDRRRKDRRSNIIDRGWLGLLTILWVYVAISLGAKQGQIDDARVAGTSQRCELTREILRTLQDFNVQHARQERIRLVYNKCLRLLPADERARVQNDR